MPQAKEETAAEEAVTEAKPEDATAEAEHVEAPVEEQQTKAEEGKAEELPEVQTHPEGGKAGFGVPFQVERLVMVALIVQRQD